LARQTLGAEVAVLPKKSIICQKQNLKSDINAGNQIAGLFSPMGRIVDLFGYSTKTRTMTEVDLEDYQRVKKNKSAIHC
jgi:hypothetical protein